MRSFGRERYATVNAFLNKSLANHPFAIAAHRGAPRGDIRENTLQAVIASKVVGGRYRGDRHHTFLRRRVFRLP